MRKNVFGRRLKRDTNQRKALFKGLMSSLVLDERIKTTEAKAKAIKANIEKLVTLAKKREESAGRFLSAYLTQDAIDKVVNRIAPQFKNRQGGYTRIARMGNRISDSASMVIMEWSEEIIQSSEFRVQNPEKKKRDKVKKVAKISKAVSKKTITKAKPKTSSRTKGKR